MEDRGTFLFSFSFETKEPSLCLPNREHYRCLPLFDEDDRCIEIADYAEPLDLIERQKLQAEIEEILESLTETQRRRLLMSADGLSTWEIARREGVDHKAVMKSLMQAKRRFQ
jgi:DNA-directed RNA polymerase specialized sigma24 family protein